MSLRPLAASAVLALLLAASAHADPQTFGLVLSGSPANAAAHGSGTLTFDDATNTLSVTLSFSGLSSPVTSAWLHCCAPMESGALAAVSLVAFPPGPGGVYVHTFDLLSASTYNPAFAAAHAGGTVTAEQALIVGMQGGMAYVSISTSMHANELPGTVQPVPEPATLALMLAGVGVLVAVRRRG